VRKLDPVVLVTDRKIPIHKPYLPNMFFILPSLTGGRVVVFGFNLPKSVVKEIVEVLTHNSPVPTKSSEDDKAHNFPQPCADGREGVQLQPVRR
jgi:hypothetical protein